MYHLEIRKLAPNGVLFSICLQAIVELQVIKKVIKNAQISLTRCSLINFAVLLTININEFSLLYNIYSPSYTPLRSSYNAHTICSIFIETKMSEIRTNRLIFRL